MQENQAQPGNETLHQQEKHYGMVRDQCLQNTSLMGFICTDLFSGCMLIAVRVYTPSHDAFL